MTDFDQLVKSAFDDVTVPDEVLRGTRERIEALRVTTGNARAEHASAPVAQRGRQGETSAAARRRSGRPIGSRRLVVAIAACLVLAAVGFGAVRLYDQPVAYVGIDVNPSIELGLNRFGIVVETTAINDDGRVLLESVALEGRSYDEALNALTTSDVFAPFSQEGSFLEISVVSGDERLAEQVRSQSDACLSGLACRGSCHEVDAKTRDEAVQAGMGVGRYRASLELMQLDPDMTLEECASLSMRELRDLIAECSGEQVDDGPQSQGYGRGREHGQGGHKGGRCTSEE